MMCISVTPCPPHPGLQLPRNDNAPSRRGVVHQYRVLLLGWLGGGLIVLQRLLGQREQLCILMRRLRRMTSAVVRRRRRNAP